MLVGTGHEGTDSTIAEVAKISPKNLAYVYSHQWNISALFWVILGYKPE